MLHFFGIIQPTRIQFDEACNTYKREEKWVEVLVGNPKERGYLNDLSLNGRIIFK
jgi:hypothetical protein